MAGEGGGRIVAQGSSEQVARLEQSLTGQVLTRVLSVSNGNDPERQGRNGVDRAAILDAK